VRAWQASLTLLRCRRGAWVGQVLAVACGASAGCCSRGGVASHRGLVEIRTAKKRAAELTFLCRRRNSSFVPSMGTAVLIRHLRSPMQLSCNRGGRGHFRKHAILSPGGRRILLRGLFILSHTPPADRGSRPHLSSSAVNLAPGDLVPASCNPTQKGDSEIFNKFGPASGVAGVPCVTVTSSPMDSSR
jgi:hypothetical protein